jgi:hypothetical protein
MRYRIYKNLHKNCFSIKLKGLVVGYCNAVTILEPRFITSETGRQRVIKEQAKNVHAFIEGCLSDIQGLTLKDGRSVIETPSKTPSDAAQGVLTYNPYEHIGFVDKATGVLLGDDLRAVRLDVEGENLYWVRGGLK